MMKKTLRWFSHLLVLSIVAAGGLVGVSGPAQAATVGTPSITYSGVSNPPTADKPQSKLWWNDGSWWANMWTTGSGWSIYRLDRDTATWVDTGVRSDSRGSSSSDTLWDGSKLYIASNVVTSGSSASGQPARLYRYSYSGGSYSLDGGFPETISNNSSESLTIDKDSTGALWATWTQATSTTNTVFVNSSGPGGTGWGTPFVVPGAADPNPTPDDLSAIVAFKGDEIGIMWTDQATGTAHWATHRDGTDPRAASSWRHREAIRGNRQVDDHLNIKTLQADPTGRVYAAVKTGLNDGSTDPNLAQEVLVVFKPGTGVFEQTTIARTGDCVSRPQILLDTENNLVRAFHTAPSTTVSGCAFSGVAGSIYEKTADMDNPVFGTGRGTPVIEDANSANMNNVTSTKQSVNAVTGIVVMATDHVAKRYWYSDRSLGTPPPPGGAPTASFTASPTSGTAPLTVNFTDTSTGGPLSWAWEFGDGETATAQNPSHTYTAAGTYTARLTVTNDEGSDTSTRRITVDPAGGGGTPAEIAVRSTRTASTETVTTTVSLPAPTGRAAGDVLVASFTADKNPTLAVPAGWTAITGGLSIGTGARVFAYYRVVGSADPASYTWTLSTAVKWGGGITAYTGVNTTTPLDSTVATAVNSSFSATSIAVGSITTASNGALLIGGLGFDSSSPAATAPTGWTERWETTGGQVAEQADRTQATAGAAGTATWTFSSGKAVAAWRTALKPGATVPPPGPTAPVASFTASPTTGTVPLAVNFTDTSTGSPTSWAWEFGDGATSTSQNPSHTYTTAGTYTARLTATNAAGSSSSTRTITVNPVSGPAAPVASFTASPTTGTAPLAVNFTDTSTGSPTSWAWEFGDGATSTSQNP
ncbi:PKD domain-containing protein, partial [Arthrobacter sp. NPDC093139]|uniref:PKD domain-containing protein n=1 Tax=Arthrobacter sp. NPDC093139 TaxID=3363945 RepID=UPI00380D0E9A